MQELAEFKRFNDQQMKRKQDLVAKFQEDHQNILFTTQSMI